MGGRNTINIFGVLLVVSVFWSQVYTEDACSLGCKGSAQGATSFLNNHKYNYAVEGVVSVFLTGADKQETNVKLNGQATVSALGNCAYVLKVSNLQISGPDGKKYKSPSGIDKPVRFTLQDGKVGSEICSEDEDTRRSLNIKRAIISLLQSPVKQSTETDVFGICPTQVSSSQEGGAVLLHRSRDLSRCGMREQGRNDLITGVFDPHAEIKNTQVLQSTLNIETKVKNGVPEKISATEEYLYKPFSVGQNGARAKVHTKLSLTGKSGGADEGKFTQVRTIIFENPHGVKLEQSNFANAKKSFADTTAALQQEASSKSAGEFAQFIRILRLTNKDDLIKLFNQAKGNALGKRVFLDGLLRAGTGASIEVAIQILKNKELNEIEQKLVYLSLGNAKHVTNEALKAASSLLDLPNIPKEVYLSVGALAGAYCRTNQCHGASSQSKGISALSQKLAAKLHNCKSKNKIEEDYIVAALKGIRSFRHIETTLVERLVHCVTDKTVKSRVKVAALEAFHADPCTPELKKAAIDTMKNRQLDSEIRIKAYLAVIDCPCAKSATEIKNLLEHEPVHQVGRFISSSLRHIRSSANPDKAFARQHYGLIRTPNKFEVDDRKYSFYREGSYDIDALGVGGNFEQTVIFSQDSFIPRSASLNLTTQLFGHSLNVLEVGGRQGNLDRVIEHFLGPKSFLRDQTPQEIYDNLKQTYSELSKTVEEKMRRKRHLGKDIDAFDKQVKAEVAPYDNELDLDIYIKLFGTDAVFLSLGDDNGFDANNVLKEIMKYVDTGIKQAKNFQQEVRAHMLFLDAELAYPTSTGFALKLDLVGSATGRFEVSSKIDMRQIFKDPKNAKVDIKLVPSTDIEVAGLFLVDADAVATGLKVVTNFHTSTGGHLVAKLIENTGTNTHGIDIQLGLPVDKQEIINAYHDLVFVTREKGDKEKEIAIKSDTDKKDYSGCFDQLSGVVGLTFCGEISVPFSVSGQEAQSSIQKYFARFPLTGPAKVKVHVQKNDIHGYHLKYLYHNNPGKQGFELLFETEGKQNRKSSLTGELVNTAEEKSISLDLQSPIKTAHGKVSLLMTPKEYVAMVKAQWDNDKYYGKAGFTVQGNNKRSVFKPIIEFEIPKQEKQVIKVDGQIVKEVSGPSTKYILEKIKIDIPKSNDVVDIDGFYADDKKSISVELNAKKGDLTALLKGNFANKDFNVEFRNTLNPNINFKLNGIIDNDNQKHHYQNDFDVFFSNDLKSEKNRITFNQLLKFNSETSKGQVNFITKNKLAIPVLDILAKVNAELDSKKVEIEIEGKYDKYSAELETKARTNIKHPGDYSVKLEAQIMDKGIEIVANRDIVDSDKSNFENSISMKGVGKYELSGVVTHKVKSDDVNIGANGHLKLRSGKQQQDIKFDFGFIQNPSTHSSHLKLNTDRTIVNYILTANRGPTVNGKLEFTLLDDFTTTGNFKMNEKDGKGNGGFEMQFKKADKKFKGDLKFTFKDPVYNADVDLFLNYGKDNNDKVHFSTNTVASANNVETKNKFVYGGKTSEFNLSGKQIEPKTNLEVEFVLPDQQVVSFKFDRESTNQGGKYAAAEEFILAHFPQRNQEPAKLSYSSKWEHDSATNIANIEMKELRLVLKDKRDWVNKYYYKNNPIGDKKFKAEFKNEMTGSLMPAPFLMMAYVHHDNDKNVIDGPTEYQVKTSYGDYKLNVDGKADIALTQQGDKKYFNEFTAVVTTPLEKMREVKWSSNVIFLLPEHKDTILEYTFVQGGKLNNDEVKFDANGKIGKNNGFTKVKLLIPNNDPLTLDTSYKNQEEGTKSTGQLEIKTTYGKGKTANIHVTGIAFSTREYSLEVKAAAPQAEKLKKLEFTVHTKNPNPDTFSLDSIVDVDGSVYKGNSIFVYSRDNPLIDIKYSCPHKPESKIYFKAQPISDTHGKFEGKVENVKELNFNFIAESLFEKDNIMLKSEGNAEKWGLKNYNVKIASKDSGSGKRLEFNVENDNKNVVSGSTSFMSKTEGTKNLIEGSGSVKVNNEQKSATFKYHRTLVSDNNEQGIENFMNVAIGERSFLAESRFTNLELKASAVYCEEKKQCANVEINSRVNANDKALQHTFNIGIDLRKLGINPEFGLELKNDVVDQLRLKSTLDIYLKQDNDKKYHLSFYNKPRAGANIGYDTGVSMELPSRTLAAESSFSAGSKMLAFPLNGEVAMYLDKKKPNQKLSASMHLDLIGNEKEHTFKGDFKFYHPKLPKDTGVNIQTKFSHESIDSFLIEGVISATNEGQAKIHLDVKPQRMKFLIQTPLVKVIDAEGSLQIQDKNQEAEFKFNLLEGKPVTMKAINKNFQYFEFTTGYSEDANRKLSIIGHIELDKRIDLSADIVLNGAKKNIGRGALFIENDLVKSDYGTSKENFEYFIRAVKGDIDKLQERVKQLGDKAQADMKNRLDRYKANLKKIEGDYAQELEKMKHELINDKTLQDINKAVNDIVHFFASILDDIVKVTSSIATTVNKAVTDVWERTSEAFNKEIKPHLDKIYENWAAVTQEYMNIVIDFVAHYGAIFTDFLDKHKAEFKELTDIFTDIFKSLTRLLIDKLTELRAYTTTVVNELMQQFKDMPIVNMIKDRYNELLLPERLVDWINEINQALQSILPTEETKGLVNAIKEYLTKKLQKAQVNDEVELRNIYQKALVAFSSLFSSIKQQLNEIGLPTSWNFDYLPSFSSSGQTWPTLGQRPSFSVINELLTGDFPDLLQYIRSYRPRSFNPLDEIPSKLRAVVVNGQHIFTFDGAHLTFPGNCYYILAHDHIDRNFTLAMELANGAPKSIALTDKSGGVIEIKENGQVFLNGAKSGFPVLNKDTVAYKETNGYVGMRSKYGVIVSCSPTLSMCHFEVSGFYLGKLRGLLGDGNNEPFDDFRLPNGKIVTNQAEFGNAYKVQKSCAAVKTPEHSHHQFHAALPAACENVFGANSPLWPLSFLMNMAPFRQACIHAVASNPSNAQQEACDLAVGFTALAHSGLLPAVMPEMCLKCTDGEKPLSIGDSYKVKLPNKQADIIVLVETTKGNENTYKDLVQPLIAQILNTLKQKKIDDLKVHLIGITPQLSYPIIYDDEKSEVKFDDESRYKPVVTTITFNNENVDKAVNAIVDAINNLSQIFGTTNVIAGYNRALDLPLRPQAVKHVISVVSEHCKKSFFLVEAARILAIKALYYNDAMTHTLITVTPDLQLSGGKPVQEVVGFGASSVLLLGDKKNGADSDQLRRQLTKAPDACIDFVEGIDGLVLSATNFAAMNPGQRKEFLQSSSQVIVDRMTKYRQQHDCTCFYRNGYQAQSVCFREDINVSRRRK